MTDTKDQRIAELERERDAYRERFEGAQAHQFRLFKREQKAETERDKAVRRADALERERDKLRKTLVPIRAIAAHAKVVAEQLGKDDTNTRHLIVIHDSSDAALTDQPAQTAFRICPSCGEADVMEWVLDEHNDATDELFCVECGAKTNQPAQDGGCLDPYTLEWIARDCERRAEELYVAAHENREGCARGSDRDQEANNLENEGRNLLKQAEYFRNLQPDQPASLRNSLANILSDAGANPGRADELLAAIEQSVADQPAEAGKPKATGMMLRDRLKRGDIGREQADAGEAFQARVWPWLIHCFGEQIAHDGQERNHRFLEEALELVQSTGCTASEAHQLVDYVFNRAVGEPHQETGGVMVTLAALCLAHGLDIHAAGEDELTRVWSKADKIRAKQAAKPDHGPLPGPSEAADAGEADDGYEYEVTYAGRKQGPEPPEGEGWECYDFDRDEYQETAYWRRPKVAATIRRTDGGAGGKDE